MITDNLSKDINKDLIKKYNDTTFMYTEYPHKSLWSKKFGEKDFRAGLKNLCECKDNDPLMLYVHIPFCSKQCFYCTCHTVITKNYQRVKEYLNLIFREIDLLHEFLNKNSLIPNIKELHIGGGSPTILNKQEFDLLIEKLQLIVDFKNLREFSLEIDPREVDKERMRYYHTSGINRVSFGVQDFDLNVQKAINRVQSPELIEELLTPDMRKYFSNGINFDIICGLPNQTKESIKKTFMRIVEMSPDRICFNYLHYSPKFSKHQVVMHDGRNGRPSKLSDLFEKKMLFGEALGVLLNGGYLRIGYDHFAKPNDDVARAVQKNTLHWNALGVTSGRYHDIIGLGLHSYSTLGDYYFQNFLELRDYELAVTNGKFPIHRGHILNRDDKIRRDVIKTLRNFFFLNYVDIEEKYDMEFKEYFKEEIVALAKFSEDGLLELSDNRIIINELGYQFTDLFCSVFDSYI